MSQTRNTLASMATMLSGVVVGGIGFLRFAQEAAAANNVLMLEVANRQASVGVGGAEASVAMPVAFTMLSGITFAVATPLGWLASYLLITGLVRSVAAAVNEERGDPLLALVGMLATRWRSRRVARAAVAAHAKLAGPAVADRVVPATRFGLTPADLVIVASRPKPDWTPGTVLACGDRWLRVGAAVERTLPQGLRTLYPLVEMPATEVFRRVVPYDLPRKAE